MLKPLKLGQTVFPINVIQGPLAGVSCAPFRLLTWRYSQPAFSCTEMLSCKTLLHQPARSHRRYIQKDHDEGPVCFQLSTNNPHELAAVTQMVTDVGADLIDLNCGCPVKKIRNKGAGSSLLTDPRTLYQLIRAMKSNTHVPVSIKIRVEGGSDDVFNQEIANVVSDAGADYLIVHGRHWTEHYETSCRYEQIQFFVEALKIPVIGNGDIACVTSLKKMFATGCAGVMIARAGVGQPWLIRQLIAEMRDETFILPTSSDIGMMFIEHITRLADLLGNEHLSLLQARKLAKYYARRLDNKTAFCTAMNSIENLSDLHTLVKDFFIP